MPSPTDANSESSLINSPGFAKEPLNDQFSPAYPINAPSSFPLSHPVPSEYPATTPPSFTLHHPVSAACRPGPLIQIGCRSEDSLTKENQACHRTKKIQENIGEPRQRRVTIDTLPEDALLEIFAWDLNRDTHDISRNYEGWQRLVHVCRKWRRVILGSPRRLNLRLLCMDTKPVRKMLDMWPPLPITIVGHCIIMGDNIVAALERNDRVCNIIIGDLPSSIFEKFLAAILMQVPFPALTNLSFRLKREADEEPPMISNSFLGGSAPHLRYLNLSCVRFPGLPKLLLSATHLVTLLLWDIPHSGYISPETMATVLSALTKLEGFTLFFRSPLSRPDCGRRRPPLSTHSVIPALTQIDFRGVSEYLEDLVARIATPLLNWLAVTFSPQLIFHTPQFAQFIGRTPNLVVHKEAHVMFHECEAVLALPLRHRGLNLQVHCNLSDWLLSMLAQVCSSSLPLISSLEHLYIHDYGTHYRPHWQNDIENDQWLELLHPFTTVKALYLPRDIAPQIALALAELVGERSTEVLPALESLFLEELHPSGAVQKAIDKFVAMRRQLSNHPIVVSRWDRK